MAVITAVKQTGTENRAVVYLWEAVGQSDTCSPVKIHQYDDATVSAFGTFGASASIALQGSPEVGSSATLFFPMTSNETAIALTATATAKVVDENSVWYKPVITNGDGSTDIDVYLMKQ
jgi:hypothetical protein